jgi:hypothetical protein
VPAQTPRPAGPIVTDDRDSWRDLDDGPRQSKSEESVAETIRDDMSSSTSAPTDVEESAPARPVKDLVRLDQLAVAADVVATEWGGIFYLINLALALELYGDFSRPLEPGLALPLWDLLALVARRLAGDAVQEDPVWGLLGRLAGRGESDPIGRGFEPPDSWRLPPDWLRAFPAGPEWTWDVAGGRLLVLHPEGFPIVDVPCEGGAAEVRLQAEIAVYSEPMAPAPGLCRRELDQGLERAGSALDRWLDRLLPYIRRRLLRATGWADDDRWEWRLLRHGASVSITAAHLDVTLSLEQHPIEIRLAGLDRDPGWVPAAARFVAFHFE